MFLHSFYKVGHAILTRIGRPDDIAHFRHGLTAGFADAEEFFLRVAIRTDFAEHICLHGDTREQAADLVVNIARQTSSQSFHTELLVELIPEKSIGDRNEENGAAGNEPPGGVKAGSHPNIQPDRILAGVAVRIGAIDVQGVFTGW